MPAHRAAIASLCLLFTLAGCQTATVKPQQDAAPEQPVEPQTKAAEDTTATAPVVKKPEDYADLWALTRDNLELSAVSNERIDTQIHWFQTHTAYLRYSSEQAAYYYYYVLNEVLKRGMPAEIALLPIVESNYNPMALSPSKAAGIWQFIPSTARFYGIRSNWWYDGRRDIVDSTNAALKYLSYLHKRFDGDWLLAIAAYNSGGGTVSKAIRKNRKAGLPTDYWHLQLPRETSFYVPKLLAVAQMINAPADYDLNLTPMANKPYFDVVDTGSQIELAKAAKLAGVDTSVLKRLNPGFVRWATDPDGHHRLLLPAGDSTDFLAQLNKIPVSQRVRWAHYKVRSGDTLSGIAYRYDTSVKAIQRANKLNSVNIRIGHSLLIPTAPDSVAKIPAVSSPETRKGEKQVHIVTKGDSLWKIAQQYGVSTEQISDWNKLSDNLLKPGQNLVLYTEINPS